MSDEGTNPLFYQTLKSQIRNSENRDARLQSYNSKRSISGKKSHSFQFEGTYDEIARRSPRFNNTFSVSLTDVDSQELQNTLHNSMSKLKDRFPCESKEEWESLVETETEKMKKVYDLEIQKKLRELKETIDETWEGKIDALHREYKQKLQDYQDAIERANLSERIERGTTGQTIEELEGKYYMEYVEKVEILEKNLMRIDKENRALMIEEITKELIPMYNEEFAKRLSTLEEEIAREIEEKKKAREQTEDNPITGGSYNRLLLMKSGQNTEALEKELEEARRQLRIEIREMEEKNSAKKLSDIEGELRERITKQLEEQTDRDFKRREKFIELEWKQKMEKVKMTMEKTIEAKVKGEFQAEKKAVLEEKNEVGRLKSRVNLKMNKIIENKTGLEKKLSDQEERFQKEIDSLQKELKAMKELGFILVHRNDKSFEEDTPSFRSKSILSQAQVPPVPKPRGASTKKYKQQAQNKENNPNSRSFTAGTANDKMYQKIKDQYKPIAEPQSMILNSLRLEPPVALQQRSHNISMDDIPSQDVKGPYSRSLQSKIHNIEGARGGYHKRFESEAMITSIIDAMRPPDLLSAIDLPRGNGAVVPGVPGGREYWEKKQDKDYVNSKAGKFIKTEGSMSYDQLKNEIMKKYQAQRKGGHVSFVDEEPERDANHTHTKKIPHKRTQTEPDFSAIDLGEKIKAGIHKSIEAKPLLRTMDSHEKEAQGVQETNEIEGFRLTTMSYKEDSDSILGRSDERYREIVGKYLDKIQSERESVMERVKESSKKVGLRTKYQGIFDVKQGDDAKVKSMKKFKQTVESTIEKDNLLEGKYLAREIFFLTDFVSNLNTDDMDYKEGLRSIFRELYEYWNLTEASYEKRMDFFDEVELTFNLDEIFSKVDVEVEFLSRYAEEISGIIDCLKRRNRIKKRFDDEKFEYSVHKMAYAEVDEVNKKMKALLQNYHREQKKEITYKGVDLSDLIKLDSWEHEYLKKIAEKELLWDLVKNRY